MVPTIPTIIIKVLIKQALSEFLSKLTFRFSLFAVPKAAMQLRKSLLAPIEVTRGWLME